MHWGKILNNDFSRANNLTNDLLDNYSKQPDFKYAAVQVIPYKKEKEKIVIIGGGAAAFEFVKSYRTLNQQDEIHVFSKEPYPFYNRILLPEYVSEHLTWEQLQKIKAEELEKLNLFIHRALSVNSIQLANKIIIDEDGKSYEYDKLIMATGSRPFIPREVPLHLPGVFTMRSRQNAEDLKNYLNGTGLPTTEQHVLIVGGGLLGLEMAAALKTTGVKITIVQRAARLMERQLDEVSSKLLAEDVTEKEIYIYFDNEVSTVVQNEAKNQLKVSLRSGKNIQCNAIIYAIGTRPNVEMAKEANLLVKRGILVNEYLQTSEENVFAIGEIAEFKQQLYGITTAAEQQARTLASYISGDLSSIYQGSVLMNVLKFEDLDLCSIGKISIPDKDPAYEEVVFQDLSHRYYKKCIIYQDRLIGAILVGDKSEFPEYRRLIEGKIELSEKRTELLRSTSKKEKVIGKLVCSCNNVGKGNLENAIAEGYTDLTKLCEFTGAGTACGSCKPELKELLKQAPKRKLPSLNGTANSEKKKGLFSIFR